MIPGEYHVEPDQIAPNTGRAICRVAAKNHGDRPTQVDPRYHSAEVNLAPKFGRRQVIGYRLNIPAGTAVRFEPGQKRGVELVAFADYYAVFGFRDEVMDPLEANGE